MDQPHLLTTCLRQPFDQLRQSSWETSWHGDLRARPARGDDGHPPRPRIGPGTRLPEPDPSPSPATRADGQTTSSSGGSRTTASGTISSARHGSSTWRP